MLRVSAGLRSRMFRAAARRAVSASASSLPRSPARDRFRLRRTDRGALSGNVHRHLHRLDVGDEKLSVTLEPRRSRINHCGSQHRAIQLRRLVAADVYDAERYDCRERRDAVQDQQSADAAKLGARTSLTALSKMSPDGTSYVTSVAGPQATVSFYGLLLTPALSCKKIVIGDGGVQTVAVHVKDQLASGGTAAAAPSCTGSDPLAPPRAPHGIYVWNPYREGGVEKQIEQYVLGPAAVRRSIPTFAARVSLSCGPTLRRAKASTTGR